MTTHEAFDIMTQMQELEFPSSMSKARTIALLKAGGIPTMSKLFAATGQNNRKNSGKRATDTEILLREVQTKERDSDRYIKAVARMNWLHERYRQAGKILDEDLLHTLGDNVVEIMRIIDASEWRKLSNVEVCAVGIFHKNLGEDMGISFAPLPSSQVGWQDGLHFAMELRDWTLGYEKLVAKPASTNDQYARVYVDGATARLPKIVTVFLRKTIGFELDDIMRASLNIESPGPLLSVLLVVRRELRKLALRHLYLPRPALWAAKLVEEEPDAKTGLHHFSQHTLQPWYVKPTLLNKWGPTGLFFRAVGGKAPGSQGERFHPNGYDLRTIGPQPQEGKGLEEMSATAKFLKTRGSDKCPFPHN
ncbi:hypothetical protein GQ53DRAFT_664827 [Thozetella sp. PMI_491]|nr:hypothetical protein GQ53DRAFT_664827 [Thozetella sp. PMI_491]